MITKIEVDGFKSLSNFELKLKPGLNILVGPNGAGKTNIILFFEFLSKIVNNQIGFAVSAVGGAGTIFKKIGRDEYQNSIEFKVYGSIQLTSKRTITYEYEAKIDSSFEKDNIFYSKQIIKIRTGSKFWNDPDEKYYKTKWDIYLSYDGIKSDKPIIEIRELNKKKLRTRFFHTNKGNIEEAIIAFLSNRTNSVQSIIASLLYLTDNSRYILTDLLGGETFNIVPSKVKEQEDAATPSGIKRDGSGLAPTLYAMKKSKPRANREYIFYRSGHDERRYYDPASFEKIVSYLRLANNTIENLDVLNDPFDNKLVVKVFIKTGEYSAILPLSSMSDGTIKWLTLISAILTSKTIFSIEEPENFLHPWMQAEIANIMREHLESKNNPSFVLMTTHSESLLNYSKPEEIILVDLLDGKTIARRIINVSVIKDEISRTGFGLGFFYFSNSLQNE